MSQSFLLAYPNEQIMVDENPYQTPDTVSEPPSKESTVRPRFARGVEYAIAILLVIALVWVVQVSWMRGTFRW